MSTNFPYDVFLSHSAKDKAVVRPLAERLRGMGCLEMLEAEGKRLKWAFSLQHLACSLRLVLAGQTGP